MYKISKLNKISPVGLAQFSDSYTISDEVCCSSGILVRSQDMHEMTFDKELLAIARAGAGVNNIPLDRCAEEGIVVFNTPGANANAVKELVLAGLILAARNIPEALEWASGLTGEVGKAVEKGKSQFAGSELKGKTLGVAGLGAIGALVANAASDLGMKVIGYDPYLSVNAALRLSPAVKTVPELKDLFVECDFVTLHLPATDTTKGMINKEVLADAKEGLKLLNFSRDKLIVEDDVLAALETGVLAKYVTDFPTTGILGKKGVVSLPHLGASTAEAEDNCAVMAANELMDYIENGNITNSVNFPAVNAGPKKDENRITFITKGEENPVMAIAELLTGLQVNSIIGKTRGEYGYTIVTLAEPVEKVPEAPFIIKARVL